MNIVAHNLTAMNTQRQFKINTNNKTKSTEKLSSGFRINRAADDAAGLTISEKMRSQIRGLNQGARNTQDGISLCQVADGALAEVSNMLHRITELSVQSANDTNTTEDRKAIQQEISQIIQEIDKISDTTTFNERKLFADEVSSVNQSYIIDMGTSKWMLPSNIKEKSFTATYTGYRQTSTTYDGVTYNKGDTITGTCITFGESGYRATSSDPYTKYSTITVLPASLVYKSENADNFNSTFSRVIEEKGGLNSLSLNDLKVDDDGMIYLENFGSFGRVYAQADTTYFADGVECLAFNTNKNYAGAKYLYATRIDSSTSNDQQSNNGIWIQTGNLDGHGLFLEIDNINSTILGIKDLDASTHSGASIAIKASQDALNTVSSIRSKIGAQQNRLEYTLNNVKNTSENTSAAESRIRDTDIAEMMVEYSKSNILGQVGQSMISQANQNQQSVLSLLE